MRFVSVLFLAVCTVALSSCLGDLEDPFGEQLKKDVAAIDSYIESNGITDVIEDISGVRFKVVTLGTGYVPRISSNVTFTYTGKLLGGAVFESGTINTKTIPNNSAGIGGLIAGFQVALPQIPNGSKATIFIPSGYAYGSEGITGIPANSNLVFEIELKTIEVTAAERNQLGSDTLFIDDFLEAEEILAVRDSTGLRYQITEPGTGQSPGWYDKVKLKYEGYLIAPGTPPTQGVKFTEGTSEPSTSSNSRVVNYIRGFQFGLMKLKKGATAFFYVPSGMAFGSQTFQVGTVTIPANANLMYKVELVDVYPPN